MAGSGRKTALVTGASGVVGGNLIRHLATRPGWRVIGVSRRRPPLKARFEHLPCDLLDAADCRAKIGALRGVTHVFHAAYIEKPRREDMVAPNLAMLANCVQTLERAGAPLAHVHVLQGTKYYGSHLGPFRTPAREDDLRHDGANFYYDLQDWVARRARRKGYTWSAARPHAVIGFALGNPMNLSTVIAVYAALCRAEGRPFAFPGSEAAYRALYQCSDAGLLARGIAWMASTPACANQAFNLTNGDLIRWQYLWPRIAEFFDLEPAPPANLRLAETMAGKAALWDALVRKHRLAPHAYRDIVSWGYGDFVFHTGHDIISSMTKARQYGFCEAIDTERMFLALFAQYRRRRIVP